MRGSPGEARLPPTAGAWKKARWLSSRLRDAPSIASLSAEKMAANPSERTEVSCDCETLTEKNFSNGRIVNAPEQKVVLFKGHSKIGGVCANVDKWKSGTIVLSVLLVISITIIIYLSAKSHHQPAAPSPPDPMPHSSYASPCPQHWIRNGEQCYYFSDAEETWNASWILCSSQGGFLVAMDTPEEWEFVSHSKRARYYWMGLRRTEAGEIWKWMNGSLFNNRFPVEGEGFCAYLSKDVVSSTWCDNHRYWICRKHQYGNP